MIKSNKLTLINKLAFYVSTRIKSNVSKYAFVVYNDICKYQM
jgi:hypothetical protein